MSIQKFEYSPMITIYISQHIRMQSTMDTNHNHSLAMSFFQFMGSPSEENTINSKREMGFARIQT
jgi:hypothetical protein